MSRMNVEDDLDNEEIGEIDDGMDEMDEMPNLFWHMDVTTNGDEIEPPEVPGWLIHITNACFGANVKSGSRTVVISQTKDGKESPLCVLLEGKNENVHLNLLFSEPVKLILKGKNPSPVSLTGYLQPPPGFGDETPSMMGDDIDDDAELEEEQQINDLIRKRKLIQAQKDAEETEAAKSEPQAKRAKLEKKEKPKNDKPQEQQQQQQQQQQQPKKTPNPKQNQPKNANQNKNDNAQKKETVSPKGNDEKKETSSEKKETPSEKKEATTTTTTTITTVTTTSDKKDGMLTLKGGIQYKDLKQGQGSPIQIGQNVQMYFVGQLDDKKIFDKVISGQAFSFEFGKGAVVKGLDMGMKGMKVGGKRRIVVPAKFGYGEQGTDNVPPNSVLTYTVEVKSAE